MLMPTNLRAKQLLAHLSTSVSASRRSASAMASASILALNPQHVGSFSTSPLDAGVAAKATELLQINHERWHMYHNDAGFHNHIAHHMLALYAFNAPPEVLKHHYDENVSYQWDMKPLDKKALQDLEDPATFNLYLFKRTHYHDFLALFEKEIQKLGLKATMDKYLWANDARAKGMMNRLYAGILHPVIHLGYGLEWNQPAIVAEALAQTATHDSWPSRLYDKVAHHLPDQKGSKQTLTSLMDECANNLPLRTSVKVDDDMRARDGVIDRGGQYIAPIVAHWDVTEQNIGAKIAELANFTCAMVFGAQREDKPFRVDFTLMHCANAVPMVAAAAHHPDVPASAKVELIRRLGQYALVTFVGQGSPAMRFDLLRNFKPKKPASNWEELRERVFRVPDDGHVIKLLRALRYAEQIAQEQGDQEGYSLRGKDWLQAGNMLIEIAEGKGDNFVRGAGFDESWV